MLKDFSNQRNVDKQEVAAAIAQLQAKNWDINAYTVADELHVQRSVLYRNSDLMDLITEARSQSGHITEVLPEQAIKRATQLEQANLELEERVHHLELEIADQVKREQEAWHLGHKAGFEEGLLKAMQESLLTKPKEAENPPIEADKPIPSEPKAEILEEEEDELPWAERPFMSGILDELVQKEFVAGDKASQSLVDYPLPASGEPKDSFDMFTSMTGEFKYPEATDLPDNNESNQPFEPASAAADSTPQENDSQKSISQDELADLLKKRLQKDPTITGSWKGASESGSGPGLAGAKFVAAGKPGADTASHRSYSPPVPPAIRKACLMLGIRPEELTIDLVHESWKREITKPGTHPDHGGDTEMAMYLNTAKDALLHWLDTQAPKLGKKFGASSRESQKPINAPDGREEPPSNPT